VNPDQFTSYADFDQFPLLKGSSCLPQIRAVSTTNRLVADVLVQEGEANTAAMGRDGGQRDSSHSSPATRRCCAALQMVSAASRWPTSTNWPACSHPRAPANDRDRAANISPSVFPKSTHVTSRARWSPAAPRIPRRPHADRVFLWPHLAQARATQPRQTTNTHITGFGDNPIPQQLGKLPQPSKVALSKFGPTPNKQATELNGRKTAGSIASRPSQLPSARNPPVTPPRR